MNHTGHTQREEEVKFNVQVTCRERMEMKGSLYRCAWIRIRDVSG